MALLRRYSSNLFRRHHLTRNAHTFSFNSIDSRHPPSSLLESTVPHHFHEDNQYTDPIKGCHTTLRGLDKVYEDNLLIIYHEAKSLSEVHLTMHCKEKINREQVKRHEIISILERMRDVGLRITSPMISARRRARKRMGHERDECDLANLLVRTRFSEVVAPNSASVFPLNTPAIMQQSCDSEHSTLNGNIQSRNNTGQLHDTCILMLFAPPEVEAISALRKCTRNHKNYDSRPQFTLLALSDFLIHPLHLIWTEGLHDVPAGNRANGEGCENTKQKTILDNIQDLHVLIRQAKCLKS